MHAGLKGTLCERACTQAKCRCWQAALGPGTKHRCPGNTPRHMWCCNDKPRHTLNSTYSTLHTMNEAVPKDVVLGSHCTIEHGAVKDEVDGMGASATQAVQTQMQSCLDQLSRACSSLTPQNQCLKSLHTNQSKEGMHVTLPYH